MIADINPELVDTAVTGGSMSTNNTKSMSINGTSSKSTSNTTNSCDLCAIKNLQYQAGSPYFDGPLLAEQSVYESKTSSCSVTGYPLTTTALPFYT